MNWTFEKPKKIGFYMINRGDIVTTENMEHIIIRYSLNSKNKLEVVDNKNEVIPLDLMHKSFKYFYLNEILINASTI